MPRFDIESFKANFKDGARSHLFYYIPQFPGGEFNSEGLNADEVSYLIRSSTLPNSTLEEVVTNWQGYDFPFASKHTFSEFTMNFNVDRQAKIRRLFENWVNLIHNPITNTYALADLYMSRQKLQLLGYNGEVVLEYTFHHAWPKTVGDITLDYASTEIAVFDVTWRYAYHTVIDKGTGA